MYTEGVIAPEGTRLLPILEYALDLYIIISCVRPLGRAPVCCYDIN